MNQTIVNFLAWICLAAAATADAVRDVDRIPAGGAGRAASVRDSRQHPTMSVPVRMNDYDVGSTSSTI
ncbi:hypothetical protein CSUB01_05139 [Colletotrichum sublineola]|uniref:Uncharacterized protein n=1 Tax=Colletotrichum sublineola TaxID=1173701 RepID=A0A066X5X6_COLSU|nr:hypothetical protein CSUB01_05139 [Colletotrichum sublineola]